MLIQELLKIRRIDNNFTQEQVANLLRVTTQAVSKWETGQSMPSIDNLLYLSDLYNVSNQTTVHLDLAHFAADILPQFVSFLRRKHITVVDEQGIIDKLVRNESLFEE